MTVWSFYNLADGRFNGTTYSGSDQHLVANIPQGFGAIPGEFDFMSARVDLESMSVIPWKPPAPDDTDFVKFSWDEVKCRWLGTPTCSKLEADSHALIDQAAGSARLRFITDVAGQQAVYLLKLQEAEAYIASGGNTPAPHIVSEAAATGSTAGQVAAAVVARALLWNTQLSPAIEGARMGGKASVSAAALCGDRSAIQAACAAAIASLDSIQG